MRMPEALTEQIYLSGGLGIPQMYMKGDLKGETFAHASLENRWIVVLENIIRRLMYRTYLLTRRQLATVVIHSKHAV